MARDREHQKKIVVIGEQPSPRNMKIGMELFSIFKGKRQKYDENITTENINIFLLYNTVINIKGNS